MSNYISKIQLPSSNDSLVYLIKDSEARETIAMIPKPMTFKGVVNLTTTLPSPTLETNGHVYKVTENGTYQGQEAKIGDMFICGEALPVTIPAIYTWYYIPSGDEEPQVLSVNGKEGAVVLDADDVNAIEDPSIKAMNDVLRYSGNSNTGWIASFADTVVTVDNIPQTKTHSVINYDNDLYGWFEDETND